MANPSVQSRFDPWVEQNPSAGLVVAHDELDAVERGLWGVVDMLCQNRKTAKFDADNFNFAVEPLLYRLRQARELLDRSRQRAFPPKA